MRRMLALAPLTLMLPGCALFAPAPLIATASAAGCSTLLDPEWEKGVAGAELPTEDTVGAWIIFGDAQTGKLDVANDRTKAAIGIVKRCEARDVAALKRAKRRGLF
jgi:hypothetical protein